jgi:acetylornithine/N-succinyldiaminopimelate aminotransferase
VLDVLLDQGFLEHVRAMAERLRARLNELAATFPGLVHEVRGQGLLLGLRCEPPNADIAAECLARGLLVVPAGDNVVRLLPPLIIEPGHIDEAIGTLQDVLQDFAGREAAQ